MGRSRYKFVDENGPYFVTGTIINWIPLFSNPWIVEVVLDSIRYLQRGDRLQLYAYVMMENHIHLIVSSRDVSKEIGDLKSFTARSIVDGLTERNARWLLTQLHRGKAPHKIDRTYQLWQEGSHPELIQGDEMMRQK